MTDDIVTRLREYNPIKGFIDWHDTMTTAADEIERLRQEPNQSQTSDDPIITELFEINAGFQQQIQEQLERSKQHSAVIKAWDKLYTNMEALHTDMEADRDKWRNIAMFNLKAIYGDQTQHHIDTCYAADGTYHGGAHGDR